MSTFSTKFQFNVNRVKRRTRLNILFRLPARFWSTDLEHWQNFRVFSVFYPKSSSQITVESLSGFKLFNPSNRPTTECTLKHLPHLTRNTTMLNLTVFLAQEVDKDVLWKTRSTWVLLSEIFSSLSAGHILGHVSGA